MALVEFDLKESNLAIPRQGLQKEMISVGIDEKSGKTLVRINSSSLGVIQECLRKAKYLLLEGWRSNSESPATLFGSAIHSALEVFYRGDHKTRKLPKFEQMELMSYGHIVEGETSDLLLQATRAFIAKAEPLKLLPESDKRSIQNGVWILFHYFKTFLDDPYVVYHDEKGPFTERAFTFRLYEGASFIIDYFGTIDLVVKHTINGDILVCDHKTSSIVGNDFYNRLKPNHQYTGYLFGGLEACGLKTNSFLVNCLQVKPKPKTARGSEPHFPRQVTTRDADDYQEFRDSVVESVSRYLMSVKHNTFPLGHVNACAMYAGCQYLQVCSAPKSLRTNILNAKFVRS